MRGSGKRETVEKFREAIDAREFDRAFKCTVDEPIWRVFASEYQGRAGIERVMSYADQLYQVDTLTQGDPVGHRR